MSREAGKGEAMGQKSFTTEEARAIGDAIGIDWSNAPYDIEQFRMGLTVELEHGSPPTG